LEIRLGLWGGDVGLHLGEFGRIGPSADLGRGARHLERAAAGM
jgi:hypothetical protein